MNLLPSVRARNVLAKRGHPVRAQLRVEQLEDRTLMSWTALGPAPILNGQTPGTQPVTGRLAAVAADPSDDNIIYVAAAGGGVWKTTNATSASPTWTPLTDNQSTLFMGALAVAPTNSNIIYAGTGEADFSGDSFYGRGVLKSINGGSTWTLLPGNAGLNEFDRRAISQIIVSPTNANVVYLAVASAVNGLAGNRGIWKSTDGGVTWTNTTAAITTTFSYTDVTMDLSDPTENTLYAAIGSPSGSAFNGVYKTTNGGGSWSRVNSIDGGSSSGEARIRVTASTSPFDPLELYVSMANTSNGHVLRVSRSDNSGASWVNITPPINYMGAQGSYDTTLISDPNDAFRVYVGGAGSTNTRGSIILESQNGGSSWTDISNSNPGTVAGPHADHHGIGFDSSGRLLVGTDGGIWRLDNPNPAAPGWTDLNGNLATVQFVGIAQDTSTANIVYGGSQDNGREKFTGSAVWDHIRGGDGGYIRVDPTTPSTVYGEFFGNSLERSTNGGANWTGIAPPLSTGGNFYFPFVLDPTNSSIILDGSNQIWESLNQGSTWSSIGNASAPIDAIATNGVFAAGGAIYASLVGNVFVTTNNGGSFSNVTPPGPVATVQALLAAPTTFGGGGVAFAAHSRFTVGKVFFTTNYGTSWSDVTGNLPDLPAWSLAFDARGTGTLYAGLDNGVYSSTTPGIWSRLGTGLPNVQVTGIELNIGLGLIDAGSYGRGVFRVPLGPDPTLPNGFLPPIGGSGTLSAFFGGHGSSTGDSGTLSAFFGDYGPFTPSGHFGAAGLPAGGFLADVLSALVANSAAVGQSVGTAASGGAALMVAPAGQLPARSSDTAPLDHLLGSLRADSGLASTATKSVAAAKRVAALDALQLDSLAADAVFSTLFGR